ncbi:putative F-box-like domain protein [Rhizoctonia solani 123E]|uniref:Putative F-box-like domain protein n=1 Tax=Rhizoctonia solani 123E TaxID=1423351 RepID=A0A074S3C2_9AGAM|nr:putative F-box-like domain protein [Rhizoctonia solani 123E]
MLSPLRLKDTCLRLLPYIPYVNPKPLSVTIPEDILRLISQYYIESALAEAKTVRQLRRRRKEYWAAVAPLAKTSTHLRMIVLGIWRMLWATCCSMSCLRHIQYQSGLPPGVRILTLGDDWEHSTLNLVALRKLETLSIDYHKLLYYDRTSKRLRILPGVNGFPSSLLRLEILHFHGSIEDILARVKSSCPKLVELRLVQCTIFNNPRCMWWRVNNRHPYLIGYQLGGVVDHAATLASYITGLPHLEHFHINHYLVGLDSVFRHRLDHKRHHPHGHRDRTDPSDRTTTHGTTTHNLLHLAAQASDDTPAIDHRIPRPAEKALWAALCPRCKRELEEPIENAERLEASLLSAKHQSLKSISFASFLSEGRTAPSEWTVAREYNGDHLVVWTQRPVVGRPLPRYRHEFERRGTQWILLG